MSFRHKSFFLSSDGWMDGWMDGIVVFFFTTQNGKIDCARVWWFGCLLVLLFRLFGGRMMMLIDDGDVWWTGD